MKLFEVEHISQKYENKAVIEDITFSLEKGEIVCLIGKSGVGKTTLFQVLSGLAAPTEGRVLLGGEDITGQPGKVGYMLQKDLLLPYMTVIDNVTLPLVISGKKKAEARELAAPFFKQFGLEGTEKKYPGQLSGGMKQRAALMRTYFFGKETVLLDEPFSALDEITKREMSEWYVGLSHALKLSTVFISHSLDEAVCLADRVLVMSGIPGKIVAEKAIDRHGKDIEEFSLSNDFIEYKKYLKTML